MDRVVKSLVLMSDLFSNYHLLKREILLRSIHFTRLCFSIDAKIYLNCGWRLLFIIGKILIEKYYKNFVTSSEKCYMEVFSLCYVTYEYVIQL